MKEFDARVWVFDPVVPFKKFAAHDPGIDTWHESVLITKELRAKIPHLTHTGYRRLQLSGGMAMSVPSVEVGLQIGKIQLPKISALVVDQGVHEVLLGRAIFQQIFSEREDRHTGEEASTEPEEPFRYSSKTKDDPSALSVEMGYPLHSGDPNILWLGSRGLGVPVGDDRSIRRWVHGHCLLHKAVEEFSPAA